MGIIELYWILIRTIRRKHNSGRLVDNCLWNSHSPYPTSQPGSIKRDYVKMAASCWSRQPQNRGSSCGSNFAFSCCRRYLNTTYNLTVLHLDLEKMLLWNLHGFGPREPSPWAPMGATCTDHAFSRSRWNSNFLQRAPFPTCYPPQGSIEATLGTAMNNFNSSPNKVSTHYITWLFSFWIWRRRCLKFAWFWPLGGLPLGPHGDHYTIWTTLNPLPLSMIPAKFG